MKTQISEFFEGSGKEGEMIDKFKSRIKLYQKQLNEIRNKYDRVS